MDYKKLLISVFVIILLIDISSEAPTPSDFYKIQSSVELIKEYFLGPQFPFTVNHKVRKLHDQRKIPVYSIVKRRSKDLI